MAEPKGYVPGIPPTFSSFDSSNRSSGRRVLQAYGMGEDPGKVSEEQFKKLEQFVEDFSRWVSDELTSVARNIMIQDFFILNELHNEPSKHKEGMIVNADGSDWNPGSGKGIYAYLSGSWTKLS